MTEQSFTPGPRQTVDRACHPTAGEGRLVFDNGPAFFLPDAGEPIPLKFVGLGGASSKPSRSWRTASTLEGERIEMDTTGRQAGEMHRRKWSPLFGDGWLVHEASTPWRDGMSAADEARWKASCGWCRFEPDDGSQPIRWQWTEVHVGRCKPSKEPRRPAPGNAESPARVEWDRWMTYGKMEFRDAALEPTEQATKGQRALPGMG